MWIEVPLMPLIYNMLQEAIYIIGLYSIFR